MDWTFWTTGAAAVNAVLPFVGWLVPLTLVCLSFGLGYWWACSDRDHVLERLKQQLQDENNKLRKRCEDAGLFRKDIVDFTMNRWNTGRVVDPEPRKVLLLELEGRVIDTKVLDLTTHRENLAGDRRVGVTERRVHHTLYSCLAGLIMCGVATAHLTSAEWGWIVVGAGLMIDAWTGQALKAIWLRSKLPLVTKSQPQQGAGRPPKKPEGPPNLIVKEDGTIKEKS